VIETPEDILVIADLPGFEKDDITIQADDSALVLTAEREADDNDEDHRIVSTERPRRFERVIPLPAAGNIDEAVADHENGVCTVTIPKDGTSKRLIGFQ
jgi:HSP20 family protein